MDNQTTESFTNSQSQETPAAESVSTGAAPFDENNVPEGLQDHYKAMSSSLQKKYAGHDDYQRRAQAFDDILKDPGFQKWYYNRDNPQSKQPEPKEEAPKLSMEDAGDPEKLTAYIDKMVTLKAQQMLEPRIAETNNKVEVMKKQNEIASFAEQNKDFWELDEKGLIEPLMKRYPSMPIDDVYKLASWDKVRQDAISRAHGIVNTKKTATTERGGVSSVNSSAGKVRVKNREEAMTLAYEAAKNNRPIPEFEIERR